MDATFCDDFDTEVAPTPRWTEYRPNSGTIDFESTTFVSPPSALRVALPPAVPPGTIAELQYTTPTAAAGITVDLDLFADTVGDAGSPSVLEIVGNPGTDTTSTARLIARSTELSLELFDHNTDPSNAQKITLLPSGLEPKTWAHVTLALDLSITGNASTVSASVTGLAPPVDKKLIRGTFPASTMRVSVGFNNVTTYEAWTFLFDNVAITVK